jgi:hypothetical protein
MRKRLGLGFAAIAGISGILCACALGADRESAGAASQALEQTPAPNDGGVGYCDFPHVVRVVRPPVPASCGGPVIAQLSAGDCADVALASGIWRASPVFPTTSRFCRYTWQSLPLIHAPADIGALATALHYGLLPLGPTGTQPTTTSTTHTGGHTGTTPSTIHLPVDAGASTNPVSSPMPPAQTTPPKAVVIVCEQEPGPPASVTDDADAGCSSPLSAKGPVSCDTCGWAYGGYLYVSLPDITQRAIGIFQNEQMITYVSVPENVQSFSLEWPHDQGPVGVVYIPD